MNTSFLLACASLFVFAGCSSNSGGASPADGGEAGSGDAASSDASGGDSSSGDASGGDASGGDASGGDASAGDAGDDGGQGCNTLVDSAQPVTIAQVAMDPPAPSGGTIADGTYELTGAIVYTGPNGPSGTSGMAQETIAVSGSTVQVVSNGTPARRTVTLATQSTSFTATDTCPDSSVTMGSYSVTGSTLLIFLDGGMDDAGKRTVVETYTKK
jgi:hypothetical protein